MKNPKVSVVITCYNYGHFVEEAVESVTAQSFDDYEIVIVNDGSTDRTREVIASLMKKHVGRRFVFIDQENEGFPASRNTGIRAAAGEYILPLDADDKLMPKYLEQTVPVLDADPAVAFAYTDYRLFGEETGAQQHYPVDWEFDPDLLLKWCYLLGCNLFRKGVWEEVGGYKDVGYEDWEFWISIAERGYIGKYVREPLYLWRRHPSSMVAGKFKRHAVLYLRIRLMHPRLYSPRIARRSVTAARAAILLPGAYAIIRGGIADYLRVNHPRLHQRLRDMKNGVLALAGRRW